MDQKSYSFIGIGSISIGLYGSGRLARVGNVSKVDINITEDKKELMDYENPGGGTHSQLTRIKTAEVALDLRELSPANLAMATLGASEAVASATATQVTRTAYCGCTLPLDAIPIPESVVITMDNPPPAPPAWAATTAYAVGDRISAGTHIYGVVTAGTSGASEPVWPTSGGTVTDDTVVWRDLGLASALGTLQVGRDYTVKGGSVFIAADATIPDATPITIKYDNDAQSVIEMMLRSGRHFTIVIDGLNEAQDGRPYQLTLHKVLLGPTSGLSLIGEDFATLPVKGTLERDKSIVGDELSKFCRMLAL